MARTAGDKLYDKSDKIENMREAKRGDEKKSSVTGEEMESVGHLKDDAPDPASDADIEGWREISKDKDGHSEVWRPKKKKKKEEGFLGS